MNYLDRAREAIRIIRGDGYDASWSGGTRYDGWQNVASGMGIAGTDKAASTTYGAVEVITRDQMSRLYLDGIPAKIIDLPIAEATREGIEWGFGSGVDAEQGAELGDALTMALTHLDAMVVLQAAGKMARLYGSAIIIQGIDDGREMDEEVAEASIRELRWLEPVAAGFAGPVQQVRLDGKVVGYTVTPHDGTSTETIRVHASRVIRLDGITLPPEISQYHDGWGLSEIQRVYDSLRMLGTADAAATSFLHERTYGVWSIRGLMGQMASNGGAQVLQRFQLMGLAKSIYHAIVLDKDSETFETGEISAGGIADILNIFPNRTAGAADIPVTRLFGVSPGGLNATGESDTRQWYDRVRGREQIGLLGPALQAITTTLIASRQGPARGQPVDWSFGWAPLYRLTIVERSSARTANATHDASYFDRGILDGEEIRQSRFGGAEYGEEITLDDEARTALPVIEPDRDTEQPGEDT